MLAGQVTWSSAPGQGTHVELRIPYAAGLGVAARMPVPETAPARREMLH